MSAKFIRFLWMPLFIVFCSCQKQVTYTYEVINQSSGTITILASHSQSLLDPSPVVIAAGSSKEIFHLLKYEKSVINSEQQNEQMNGFEQFAVQKNDSIFAKTDFLRSERWKHEASGKERARYTATVTDTDF